MQIYNYCACTIITIGKNKLEPQRKNLGPVIGVFKRAVATYARKNNITFDWHTLSYESIIRDEDSLAGQGNT